MAGKKAAGQSKSAPSARNIAVLAAVIRCGSEIGAASHLGITIDTVKWHIKKLFRTSGCQALYQLVAWAIFQGYVDETVLH